jgi:hypothetical protein
MNVKALLSVLVFFAGVSVAGEVLARNELSPEQWARAREAARQLKPPVDFDALMKEVDQFGVECTGDLTRKARIIICGQKVENAKIEADTQAIRADTEATRARTEKLRKENAELIREIQQRIREDK